MAGGMDAARAAEQDNPALNRHFLRRWAEEGATGPAHAAIRAWHPQAVVPPPARANAEAAWKRITRGVAP